MEVDAIIEIPVNSHLKFEIDYDYNRMRLDRVIKTSMGYPGNYGYVPKTLCGDGDALDIVMPIDYQVPMGTVVRCKVVGVLIMEDEAGQDEKLVVYPTSKVDKQFDNIKDLKDVRKDVLEKIEHFFNHYKDLSPGKFVKTDGFRDRKFAEKVVNDSIKMYNDTLKKGKKTNDSKKPKSKKSKKKSSKKN